MSASSIEGIKHSLSGLNATVHKEQGRIFVYGIAAEDRDEAVDRLTRVFGVHSISPAVGVEKDWDTIVAAARDITEKAIGSREKATFKCFCRRSDKGFFMNSEEINRELGHEMLEAFPNLSVDIQGTGNKALRGNKGNGVCVCGRDNGRGRYANGYGRTCYAAHIRRYRQPRCGIYDGEARAGAYSRAFLQLSIHQRTRAGQGG